MQLALVKRRALGAAALGLVLRDDLRRDVHKVFSASTSGMVSRQKER